MIQVDLSWAVTWYLLASVGGLLVFWAWVDRIGYRRLVAQELSQMRECAICTYLYVERRDATSSQCPRCGSYNTVSGVKNQESRT